MANHPINLALRFVLELAGLFAYGYWGWTQHSGAARILFAVGLPLIAAAIWGTFRVPGDPNQPPVRVPGSLRLLIELVYFAGAVWALDAAHQPAWAIGLALVVLLHYLVSFERLAWIVRQ